MREKIKVLFLAADPFRDRARLELEDEMRAIRRALAQGKAHDTLELESHFGTRTRDLQLALLEYQPQIVHFSGHGDSKGVIYLSDAAGRPAAVGKAALGRLFDMLESEVRVVVLNACNTYPIVETLRDMVDYAIGTNRAVSDQTALTFSRAFYTALASGAGVQQAYDLAVNQLELDGSDEAAVPLIRKRFGADRRPLLAMRAAQAAAESLDGEEVLQVADLGHIDADRATIIASDQQGSGPGRGRVEQRITSDGVSGGEFNLIGSRIVRGKGAN
ncbi:MAG TPA: CHAT domain-containing protein [Longimicrobium sp.]|nr:CHAT domain-containing protein [Longimicrobium sp.]